MPHCFCPLPTPTRAKPFLRPLAHALGQVYYPPPPPKDTVPGPPTAHEARSVAHSSLRLQHPTWELAHSRCSHMLAKGAGREEQGESSQGVE